MRVLPAWPFSSSSRVSSYVPLLLGRSICLCLGNGLQGSEERGL